MALVLTEEQTMLRDMAKDFFTEQVPVTNLRKLRDEEDDLGYDKQVWAQIVELGFAGILIPEEQGGTGFGPRDRTPEGTRAVLDREAPGLAEAMRLVNPLGRLSRGVAGTLETALIVNTPGSSKGCVETIDAVIDVLPHAVTLLVDNYDPHPSGEGQGHGPG